MTESPTAPRPKTATEESGLTLQLLYAAPYFPKIIYPSCRNPASEHTHLIRIGLLMYFRSLNLINNRVFRHGRTAHKMINLFPIFGKSCSPIRHDPLPLEISHFRTEIRLIISAENTGIFFAFCHVARDHEVTDF